MNNLNQLISTKKSLILNSFIRCRHQINYEKDVGNRSIYFLSKINPDESVCLYRTLIKSFFLSFFKQDFSLEIQQSAHCQSR